MSTTTIILLVLIGVALACVLAYIIIKGIQKGWFKKLYETIKQAMQEAEESGKSGAEKQAYVLEQVKAKCEELGIPYALVVKLVKLFIEQTIKGYNTMTK